MYKPLACNLDPVDYNGRFLTALENTNLTGFPLLKDFLFTNSTATSVSPMLSLRDGESLGSSAKEKGDVKDGFLELYQKHLNLISWVTEESVILLSCIFASQKLPVSVNKHIKICVLSHFGGVEYAE